MGSGPAPVPSRARRRCQAAKASPGRSRATQGRVQPLPAGRSPGRARSQLAWGLARRRPPLAIEGAARRRRCCQPKAKQRMGGRSHPHRAKPGWGRKATRLGPGPAPPPSRARRRGQAAKALPGRSRATQGRARPLPTGRSPGRARKPLGWGQAPVQPARRRRIRLYGRRQAEAATVRPEMAKAWEWMSNGQTRNVCSKECDRYVNAAAEQMNALASELTKKMLIGEERVDYLERAQRREK